MARRYPRGRRTCARADRGTLAYQYDAAARPLKVWNFVGEFAPTQQEIIDVVTAADDEYVAQSYLVTPFGTASEAAGFDRQRTFGRRLALEQWKVLVRARWSLVDHFEEGGRRYLLAYGNAPDVSAGPESFTDREREIVDLAVLGHSPKLIAYELGLAASTVRVHLTNASKKLGVRTRKGLITKYREWLFRQAP